MLYLTCTMISSVDLAHYGVSHVKDWVSGDCGTSIPRVDCAVLTSGPTFVEKFLRGIMR